MASGEKILAVNPGSMTTKIAIYDGEEKVFSSSIEHPRTEIAALGSIPDQLDFRERAVVSVLEIGGQLGGRFDAVVGRGGLLKSVPSGAYEVTDPMLEDAREGYHGQHASNLGALLADALARDLGGRAFIVDPVSVDESEPLARFSGLKGVDRKTLSHALNIKATAKKAARDIGKPLDSLNLVVAHMGSGISIAPLKKGRIVDASNAYSGGPFSPERTGALPLMEMLDFMDASGSDTDDMRRLITREGGLVSYLGTNDFKDVSRRAREGDAEAAEVVRAMCYQIAKEIGAMATVLSGDIQAIILTGALAASDLLASTVSEAVSFIADVVVYPGEDELEALSRGALEVLRGETQVGVYPSE